MADWYHANLNNNYLGTYTFSSLDALRGRHAAALHAQRRRSDAGLLPRAARRLRPGRPADPQRADAQPRPALQLSDARATIAGVRAARWRHLGADARAASTTLRASGGIFHGWLDPGIWWQTVRSDGQHQRDIIITNPSYPDPGTGGVVPPANTYRLGDYKLNKNVRYSAGIDQQFSPRASVNVLFNYYHQDQLPRGMNLNPLVDGVRPDPGLRQHHRDRDRRPAPSGTSSTSTSTSIFFAAVSVEQPDTVQLAPARRSTAATRSFTRGAMRSARSTCRPAARSTPNGATDLPTIRTAST